MHKRKSRRFGRLAAVLVAAVAVVGVGWGTAHAVTSASAPLTGTIYACVTNTGQISWLEMSNPGHPCASGLNLEHWSVNGPAGVSVTGAKVNASGDLMLTFSNGKTTDAGHVAGSSYQPVTATYVTTITNDPDSNTAGGNWATDTFARTFTVLRHNAVPASNCGATAANGIATCWFYTATLADVGSFVTIAGATSPNDSSVKISGVLSGTINGAATYEFYASASAPDSTNPLPSFDATKGTDSSNWPTRFFASGTAFGTVNENTYSYNYVAPTTCETMVQASTGNLRNITGANACG